MKPIITTILILTLLLIIYVHIINNYTIKKTCYVDKVGQVCVHTLINNWW